jgi:hypothetical protein
MPYIPENDPVTNTGHFDEMVPYQVMSSRGIEIDDMKTWGHEHLKGDWTCLDIGTDVIFFFQDPREAMMFKLSWT